MNQSKIKLKKMQQKKWWSYAVLAAGIFIFTQGCSIINENIQYALPLIIFSVFMHSNSMKDLGQKFFKRIVTPVVNLTIITLLIIIAVACYYIEIKLVQILMLNIAAIVFYFFICAMSSKFYHKN